MRGTGLRNVRLGQPSSHFFDRLNERLCRKWFCQIGDTSGLHRRRTNGVAIVGSDVDHRQRDPGFSQSIPDLYSRLAVQLNVENNANRLPEIIVSLKCLRRLKEKTVVAGL